MGAKKRKPTPGSESPAADLPELPERWSAARKTELVLRLLRGEALDAVSRESQVPAHELAARARGDRRVAQLTTIPGVGPVSAQTLVAAVDRIERFASAKKLVAYAGLVPSVRASGERIAYGRITK